MEQPLTTPDVTRAELNTLRNLIHTRLVARGEKLLRALEALDVPETANEIGRQARALAAIHRLFDRLLPDRDATETGDMDRNAAPDTTKTGALQPPVSMNRHQRRKAEAAARRAGTRLSGEYRHAT